MGVETIEISEAFRPQSCPNCEYSLAGHPPAGICPECGEAYDTDTIELVGIARGTHVTISNASPTEFRRRFLPWLVVVPIFFALWAWALVFSAAGQRSFLPILFIIPLAWTDPIVRLLRRLQVGPAQARVRLNAAGIMQEDDIHESLAAARWRLSLPYLFPLLFGGWVFFMPGSHDWLHVILFVALMLMPLTKTLRSLRDRRQLLASDHGSKLTPAAKRWTLAPRFWGDLRSIDVAITDDDMGCRIVATSHEAAKRTNKGDVVDIEVRCTREEAEALRGRLRAWRRGERSFDP